MYLQELYLEELDIHLASVFCDSNFPLAMHETPILCMKRRKKQCKQYLSEKIKKKHTEEF